MSLPRIPPLFDTMTSIVIVRFDVEGKILDRNDGFTRLSRIDDGSLWQSLARPRVDELAAGAPFSDEIVYRGLLTIGNPAGDVYTVSGTVFGDDDQLLLVAGYDIDELERMSRQLLDLNSQLEVAHRELVRANRMLGEREQVILKLSLTDPLTGLANRRHFDTAIAIEVERARERGHPLSLVLMDLDHFKAMNDEWGHAAGDRILRAVADRMQGSIRQSDLLVRYGGEEFVAVMPGLPLPDAVSAAGRLRERIAAEPVDELPPVTASFGVAALRDGESAEDLVARADAAMYRAKAAGRNRVEMDPEPAETAEKADGGIKK